MQQLDNDVTFDYANAIDRVHDDIISAFNAGARFYVLHRRQFFHKFWWNQDMDLLKAAPIESTQAGKAAGKRYIIIPSVVSK